MLLRLGGDGCRRAGGVSPLLHQHQQGADAPRSPKVSSLNLHHNSPAYRLVLVLVRLLHPAESNR